MSGEDGSRKRPHEDGQDQANGGGAAVATSPAAAAPVRRTSGVYIPPAKLRQMREEIKDKASEEYQRLTWEALKKSLNGLINKVLFRFKECSCFRCRGTDSRTKDIVSCALLPFQNNSFEVF